MATWKEKGVVPDSDDDDDLDLQSIASEPEGNNETRSFVTPTHNDGGREGRKKALRERDDKEEVSGVFSDFEAFQKTQTPKNPLQTTTSAGLSVQDTDDDVFSSPTRLVPKLPDDYWDLSDDDIQRADQNRAGTKSTSVLSPSGKHPEDDISTSYVQITSATSTPLSSPPRSQSAIPLNYRSREENASPLGSIHASVGEHSQQPEVKEPIAAQRSLRRRNLNQLYPYHMELEKYRRELKARGIAPTLIAESQDRSHRTSTSPELDSQGLDTQENESNGDGRETEESQGMDFVWDELHSSSISHPRDEASDNEPAPLEPSSDEEFPDIDELLRDKASAYERPNNKRHVKTYSLKKKRRALTKIQTRPKSLEFDPRHDIFDIPASPPATSSPFVNSPIRKSLPRATSRTSDEPIAIEPSPTKKNHRHLNELPTPGTSAAKPTPIFIDSESDERDPFADDPDESISTAESTSDESVQIRRVGKKIRGVLPASHLRLDMQRGKRVPAPRRRDSLSESPVKSRRGIALPKFSTHQDSPSNTAFPFSYDETDEEDDLSDGLQVLGMDFEDHFERNSLIGQSRIGAAEVDDTVDAMLPTRKRASKTSSASSKKRARIESTSRDGGKRQPRTTEHLGQVPSKFTESVAQQSNSHLKGYRQRQGTKSRRPRKPHPPSLGILDVINFQSKQHLPQFMRVAARTARSQRGQGRHSPSKVYIRLANREDTFDAQSVLQDWKEGRIKAKDLAHYQNPRPPLQLVQGNRQQTLQNSPSKKTPPEQLSADSLGSTRRLLIVKRGVQRSMNDFVSSKDPRNPRDSINRHNSTSILSNKRGQPSYQPPVSRPAQLESSEYDYTRKYPVASFGSSKKLLDTLYRHSRNRVNTHSNIQLDRFLSDNDLVQECIEHDDEVDIRPLESPKESLNRVAQSKKRTPRRLDVDAAKFRQPSNQLILEYLNLRSPDPETDDGRLLGLGKYGTKYPLDFDVSALGQGVCFHETTFIGSGKLAAILEGSSDRLQASLPIPLTIGSKSFNWGFWNEIVASEIGVCFDWILDQVSPQNIQPPSQISATALEVVEHVRSYIQHQGASANMPDLVNILERMTQIMNEFAPRLDAHSNYCGPISEVSFSGILEKTTLLSYQLLLLSRRVSDQTSLSFKLEGLLTRCAGIFIAFLLSRGLESVRQLYDDLQYLSFRERGIRSDQYTVQGWLVVIKVLQVAQIPRGSFWDVTNPYLISTDIKTTQDARVMEKTWYSLFSLLPLCEFDERGVLRPGTRQHASFENWPIPQQISKRVFELYNSKSRQSPGFNDYCRAVFSRCHYLMVEWGWWKCNGLVGTLFDFFASRNLAHLRNEEVYTSPRFLQELHKQPSLDLEPEDRCFHIFLKIVALGIKHLQDLNDSKNVRNLVARLLPNHDRQYPKEEELHQHDLSSLRNHHDLLCTLYWAAPSPHRPSLSLLQKLVAFDRSHKEACLVNLRAWENLARFIVTHPHSHMDFAPVTEWVGLQFITLFQQHNHEREEHGVSIKRIQDMDHRDSDVWLRSLIARNDLESRTTLYEIELKVRGILTLEVHKLFTAGDQGVKKWTQLIQGVMVKLVLSRDICDKMTRSAIDLLTAYIDLIEQHHMTRAPLKRPLIESQGCTPDSMVVDLMLADLIHEIRMEVLPLLVKLLGRTINGNISFLNDADDVAQARSNTIALAIGYGRVIALLLNAGHIKSMNEIECQDSPSMVFEKYTAYWSRGTDAALPELLRMVFLRTLVKFLDLSDGWSKLGSINVLGEWLVGISKPVGHLALEHARELTFELWNKPDFWLPDLESHASGAIGHVASEASLIMYALQYMWRVTSPSTPRPSEKTRFQYAVKLLMGSIQYELERMDVHTSHHAVYVQWVQVVTGHIRTYCRQIQPLSAFFLQRSSKYWPADADPNMFVSTLMSYCVDLKRGELHQKNVFSRIIHFLLASFRQNLLMPHGIQQHRLHLKEAAKNFEFTRFVLQEILPVAVEIGFSTRFWVFGFVYFPAILEQAAKSMSENGEEAEFTFKKLTQVLDCVRFHANLVWDDVGSKKLEVMLAITLAFWKSIQLSMATYAHNTDRTQSMNVYETAFASITAKAYTSLNRPISEGRLISIAQPNPSKFYDIHRTAILSAIEPWVMDENDQWIGIRDAGAISDYKKVPLLSCDKSGLEATAIATVGAPLVLFHEDLDL